MTYTPQTEPEATLDAVFNRFQHAALVEHLRAMEERLMAHIEARLHAALNPTVDWPEPSVLNQHAQGGLIELSPSFVPYDVPPAAQPTNDGVARIVLPSAGAPDEQS